MTLEKSTEKKKRILFNCVAVALIGCTFFSIIKRLFVGLDVDEQYAVTLAYRIASGDKLLKELWEPHQLSGILPGFFVFVYMNATGGTQYVLLLLRIIGLIFQIFTALLWYKAFSKRYNREKVFLSCILILNVLPKWIQSLEFANMEIWFLLISISLLVFCRDAIEKKKIIYACLLGIVTVLLIWAYPSCVFLFMFFVISLRKEKAGFVAYLIVCVGAALAFCIYLFSYMTFSEMLTYVGYVFSDGSHSQGLADRMTGYGLELLKITAWLMLYIGIATLFSLAVKIVRKNSFDVKLCVYLSVIIASIDQVRLWMINECPNVHTQVRFLIPLLALVLVNDESKDSKWDKNICLISSIISLLSVLTLTNLTIQASLIHTLPACLYWFISAKNPNKDRFRMIAEKIAEYTMVVVSVFAITFLVRVNEGWHEDILLVKQKVLYDAPKLVYCPYMIGYEINDNSVKLQNVITDGSKVLYIGSDTMLYMAGSYEVCSASTISTPVFDNKYLEYFEINQNKLPDAVVIDKEYWINSNYVNESVKDWILQNFDFDEIVETDFIYIVKKRNNMY